jgi:hypothetical protein
LGYVSAGHEQRIMSNGVITSPHDFKQPSGWYNRVKKITKYAFEVIAHGIKSIPDFIKILADIMLLNAQRRMAQVKVMLGWVRIG